MIKNTIRILIISLMIPLAAKAQKWNLDRCIKYALERNLDIEEQELKIQKGEISLWMSKKEWLPEVRAEIGEYVSLGNMNASSGTMSTSSASKDLNYTTAKVGATIQLLDQYRTRNQIAANKFSLEASTQYLDAARRDISIQVATQYLQVLYYKGLAKIARHQVEISQDMARRAGILVKEGKRPDSEKATAEAQVASDQYTLIKNESDAKLACIHLAHLLNIENPDDFDIEDMNVDNVAPNDSDIPSAGTILTNSLELDPSILGAKAELNSAEHLLKVTKRELYPHLYLDLSVQSTFYHLFKKPTENWDFLKGTDYYDIINQYMGYSEPSFASQFFDKNRSELIGLRLNIPIFNRFQTRGNIRKANIDILNRQNNLEKKRLALRKEIQQAYYNALTSVSMYKSAAKAAESADISEKYENVSYEAGRSTLYDLNTSIQKRFKAQQDVLQSKYEFLIRKRILEFYIK